MSSKEIRIPVGSSEYLKAPITADVELDAQTVQLSKDGGTSWLAAEWVGDAGTTRTARTSSPVAWTRGTYHVYAKLTDSPEVPIVKCGTVIVS